MEILIDVPIGKEKFFREDQFFFSIELSDTESIAFDYTFARHRVMKQVLVGQSQSIEKPTKTWETLRVVDGKFMGKHRVEWIDRREKSEAIINGNIWRTAWEKPLPKNIKDKLLSFSSKIYSHKNNLSVLEGLFKDLDEYIAQTIDKYIS